ncbi:MAG: hypothetical protein K9W44_14560 [Candidatus Lokiarchaeota archaeon]|nr:hypothetical protein [Candidatus Harpocratesius repetitus]
MTEIKSNAFETGRTYSELQKIILKILLEGPYRQNELQTELQKRMNRKITPQNLSYHLNVLGKKQLIEKKIIVQIGNARIDEIRINTGHL